MSLGPCPDLLTDLHGEVQGCSRLSTTCAPPPGAQLSAKPVQGDCERRGLSVSMATKWVCMGECCARAQLCVWTSVHVHQ